MASFVVNEEKLINNSVFKYEERLNSQYSRFLDTTPTFVTYFHINNDESTSDEGFQDVEALLGPRSPLRFQKVEHFPLYGLDPVVMTLNDGDQGLDTSYEGECVVLPNTIKPLQNDYFILEQSKAKYIFRVSEIKYDSIKPDNYYKISFIFAHLSDERTQQLENQVEEKFTCILSNIGTENNCLIKEEYMNTLEAIDKMYDDIVSTYLAMFYNERYNCLLGSSNKNSYKIYDPLQTDFINNHNLFNKKNTYKTLILSSEFTDPRRKLKYEKSIYRFVERCDISFLKRFAYGFFSGAGNPETSFSRWNDKTVKILDIQDDVETYEHYYMFSEEMVNNIKYNYVVGDRYTNFIIGYLRKDITTIHQIPLDLADKIILLDDSEEIFFFVPIILYMIKTIVNDFMSTKK